MPPKTPVLVNTERDDTARECPTCHRLCDAYTSASLERDRPRLKPGDVTVCAYCGTILKVTTIGWRPATEAEINEIELPLRQILLEYVPNDPRFRGRG